MKHNFLRRMGALLLALAMVLPMAVTTAWADPVAPTPDSKIELNETSLTLAPGETRRLTAYMVEGATRTPIAADNFECRSSDAAVRMYSDGKIEAIREGTATLTFMLGTRDMSDIFTTAFDSAGNPITASCTVKVENVSVISLQFDNPPDKIAAGTSTQLKLNFNPPNATDKAVSWSSDDPGVATVSASGLVQALKPGNVRITARSQDNYNAFAHCNLTVTDPLRPVIELLPETVPVLTSGETFQLRYSVTSGGTKTEWISSNQNVATVDERGLITCAKKGSGSTNITIRVTYTDWDGKTQTVSDTRTVTVRDSSSMDATNLTPKSPTTLTLSVGQEMQLEVNVVPATAYVTWISEDRSVATVDLASGMVKAVATGKTTVTATAQKADGTPLTAEFKITVVGQARDIVFNESGPIRFDKDDGRTRNVSVSVTPANTNTYIVWNSSNSSIVGITNTSETSTSAALTIPGTRPAGESTITATVYERTTRQPVKGEDDKPLTAELTAIVSGIVLTDSALTMYEGEARPLSIQHSYGAAAGTSATSGVRWTSSDPSVATMESGTLNAWGKGTTAITATTIAGGYTASCTVTVVEDAGTIVSAGSASAGNSIKLGTGSVISQLNRVANERAGGSMEYINGIFISPSQGVVYNTYTSEADTGAGVSMSEKYYVNRTTPASEYIGALSFVPNKNFSGEARITYVGRANGRDISGVITVNVNGMGQNGSDVTYTANAAPVTFLAEDFNTICINKTGRSLKYVTFTPTDASRGTLYENYTNAAHPGQKVLSTTQYNRTGSPSLNSVTFVPAEGYGGTVTISYRAMDSGNTAYTGTVTINVNRSDAASDPADIYYTAPQDGWATFRTADFANASLRVIGEPLSHVRFSLPPSSEGTLFYNYRGFGNYDSAVASTTSYYWAGTPALGSVSFVPATTSSGRTAITYTGYSTRGTTFTGKVYVGEGGWSGISQGTYYDYTVNSGAAVTFNAGDFNSACLAATGATLNYIRFNSLPTSSQGTLRYRTGSSTYYSSASTSTYFYRTSTNSWTPLIGNVSFLANASYTGIVRIPYTGYNTNGGSFTGEVTIQVNPNTIVYTGTTASPLRLNSSHIRGTVSDTFSRELSYIEFTGLPSTSAGRMYLGYSGYGTGSQVSTGVRYYVSSTPSIDRISFVPKARYSGDATATYTAYSTSGERMTGQITFRISSTGSSSYFTDMGNHSWAAPSVDYLYQNGVTNGVSATSFAPNQPILRRDFVLMLYRAFRFGGGSAVNTGFADVPANAYYAQAVSAAKQLGIANGAGGNFMPNSQITRQDAMVMIKNAMVAAGKIQGAASTTILNNFPDGAAVSSYARDAVSTLVHMGAVNGSNGMLYPRASITRAEAAVILHFVMTA